MLILVLWFWSVDPLVVILECWSPCDYGVLIPVLWFWSIDPCVVVLSMDPSVAVLECWSMS